MWSEREEERVEVTIKEEKAKDKHEKCTKKRNDLGKHIKLRVCRREPFIKDNFIS
jgi:hypothetical protein